MARFRGAIGYAQTQTETAPGVWTEGIIEKTYSGDVLQNIRKLNGEEKVNPDLTMQNLISVVADAYAGEHFHAIRYIRWAGVLWTVSTVEVQGPRLLLRLGVKYDGPTAS